MKKIVSLIVILIIFFVSLLIFLFNYNDKNTKKNDDKKVEEDVKIELNNIDIDSNGKYKISSIIKIEGGNLVEDYDIDTTMICKQKIIVKYKNNKDEVKEKEITINIKDKEAPSIRYQDKIVIKKGSNVELLKDIVVSDNSNEKIIPKILGNYDINKPGEYNLKIVAQDSSGNKKEIDFKLIVEDNIISNSNSNKNNTSNKVSNKVISNKTSNKISNKVISNKISNKVSNTSDNIIVKRALSKVGKEQMNCTMLVDYAIQGVGKTMWIYGYAYYNQFTKTISPKDLNEKTVNNPDSFTIYPDDTKYLVYYYKNNKVYKIEQYKITPLSNGGKSYGFDKEIVNSDIGKTVYKKDKAGGYADTYNIKKVGKKVSLKDIKPGDILYYENNGHGSSHVAVYIGNGKAVHGGWTNYEVVVASMYLSKGTTPEVYRVN